MRRTLIFMLSVLLAWADLLLFPLVPARAVSSGILALGLHGVFGNVAAGAWILLFPAIVFALACWLAWSLAPGIRSPYKWLVLILGGSRLLLALAGVILLPIVHYYSWMPWYLWVPSLFSFVLTVACVLILCEPYSSAPLTRHERLVAFGLAALGACLLTVGPLAPMVSALTGVVVYSVIGLLGDAGVDEVRGLALIWGVGSFWLSFLFVRTVTVWTRTRRTKASVALDAE